MNPDVVLVSQHVMMLSCVEQRKVPARLKLLLQPI